MANRVWIELERPESIEQGDERARLLSLMLQRLGIGTRCWFDGVYYCFTLDAAGTYVQASDRGHWFNLDRAGADINKS